MKKNPKEYQISEYKTISHFPVDICLLKDVPSYFHASILNGITAINKQLGISVINPNLLSIPTKRSILVNFYRGKHLRHTAFDGQGFVLAHAEMPPGDRICFDSDEMWTHGMLKTTFIHEFLHTMGFNHCDRASSIMYYKYTGDNKNMDTKDVEDFFKIYPFLRKLTCADGDV